jgi:hypothetical protein
VDAIIRRVGDVLVADGVEDEIGRGEINIRSGTEVYIKTWRTAAGEASAALHQGESLAVGESRGEGKHRETDRSKEGANSGEKVVLHRGTPEQVLQNASNYNFSFCPVL